MILVLCFVLAAPACGRSGGSATDKQDKSPEDAPAYPSDLSAQSSPLHVGRVLIRALDQNDGQTLRGLVAAGAAANGIDAIYRKHGKRSDMTPERAAKMTAAGWAMTYSLLPGRPDRGDGREDGRGTAVVLAQGKSRGGGNRAASGSS